ncbi:hypothetical protein RHMOL_Rhmol11G0215500 [Rhododendron molle]|uniref:Uncharacterized protein n=1 Tax=Rhododendron molle TaxID=49168 RepID=A0ACC0LVD4_RHOML|nr:hypothetical protein RHMOL_Rhmol11G0215500 [Rhododendron molle]
MGRDNPPPKVNLSQKRKSSDAPAVAPEKTAPVQKKHQKQPSSATVPSTEKHARPASSPHSKQPAEKATHRQSALTEKSSSAAPFMPSFMTEDGRRLTVTDSVPQDPPLVITLLQGLGLPRDMKQVPRGIEGNLDALFTSIAMDGQSSLALHEKLMNLGHRNAQLKKKVEELEAAEKNWVQKEAEKNHRITQLEGELVTERGKRLATELMKKELEELRSEKENLPKLLDASFDEGYKKCGADLQEDVEKIQKRRYRRGYRVGWADALSKSFELLKVKMMMTSGLMHPRLLPPRYLLSPSLKMRRRWLKRWW